MAGIQSDVELHRGPGRRRSLRASGQKHGSRRADDYADTYGDDEAEEAETATGRGLVAIGFWRAGIERGAATAFRIAAQREVLICRFGWSARDGARVNAVWLSRARRRGANLAETH